MEAALHRASGGWNNIVLNRGSTPGTNDHICRFFNGYGWRNPNSGGQSQWFELALATTVIASRKDCIDCDQATPTVQLWQNTVNKQAIQLVEWGPDASGYQNGNIGWKLVAHFLANNLAKHHADHFQAITGIGDEVADLEWQSRCRYVFTSTQNQAIVAHTNPAE